MAVVVCGQCERRPVLINNTGRAGTYCRQCYAIAEAFARHWRKVDMPLSWADDRTPVRIEPILMDALPRFCAACTEPLPANYHSYAIYCSTRCRARVWWRRHHGHRVAA